MELLIKQCEHNHSEEPCDECALKIVIEVKENPDTYEYDYNKRLWF